MTECKVEIEELLPKPKCDHNNCSFLNVYQPPLENDKFTVRNF